MVKMKKKKYVCIGGLDGTFFTRGRIYKGIKYGDYVIFDKDDEGDEHSIDKELLKTYFIKIKK